MKELYYRDENNYYKFCEISKEYLEDNIQIRKENKILYENLEYKDKQVKKLNTIINELEKWLEEDLKEVYRDCGHRNNIIREVYNKLKELKENK